MLTQLFVHLALAMQLAALAAGSAQHSELADRKPLPKLAAPPGLLDTTYEQRLIVKFHDRARVRLGIDGQPMSPVGQGTNRDIADLATELDDLLGQGPGDARRWAMRPLIGLAEAKLGRLERDAAARSGRAQPDLAGMFVMSVEPGSLERVAALLHASPLVEFVHFQALGVPPPSAPGGCADVAPATGDYTSLQGYFDGPAGLGMPYAWGLPGGRGEGVRIADCEYGFREQHEDLCHIIAEPGIEVHPNVVAYGWHEHGTAVLGQLVGGDNGYGITGLVPDAQALFFFEWSIDGRRRVEAITNAVASLEPGDVVLLEMQTVGLGGGFAPAEVDPAVWTITRVATDLGICVVAAAGNGNQNLDSSAYAGYRSRGDSGAIIVGAGSADERRDKLTFSTYGSRVDLQAWGEDVFTAGYGSYAAMGGDPDQSYTHRFSGTSSASPMIAAAVASVQGVHRARWGRPMAPQEVRDLLRDTGRPQGNGGHIGPMPDMVAAMDALLADGCLADFDGDGQRTVFDILAFFDAFEAGRPWADLDGDGSLTVLDFLAFQTAFDAGC